MEDYDDQHIHIHFDVHALNAFVSKLVSLVSSDGSVLKLFVDAITVPIINQVRQLEDKMTAIDDSITRLKTSVANLTSVDQSAVTLIQGLKAQLDAAITAATNAGATTAQLQDLQNLADSIDSQDTQLAAAVSTNTPAPPTTISGGAGGGLGDTSTGAAGGPTVSGAGTGADTSLGAAGANNPNSVTGAADTTGGTIQTTV